MKEQKLAEQFWSDGYLLMEDFFCVDLINNFNKTIINQFSS